MTDAPSHGSQYHDLRVKSDIFQSNTVPAFEEKSEEWYAATNDFLHNKIPKYSLEETMLEYKNLLPNSFFYLMKIGSKLGKMTKVMQKSFGENFEALPIDRAD